MEMDGETINAGDKVFDLLYGSGTVIELLPVNRFRVTFPSKIHGLVYDVNGVGVRYSRRTLFWYDPVFTAPPKNPVLWSLLRPIIMKLVTDATRVLSGRIV